jgi:hypothetical protein
VGAIFVLLDLCDKFYKVSIKEVLMPRKLQFRLGVAVWIALAILAVVLFIINNFTV